MILSMQSNIPLEEVAKAHPGPKWMQLYFPADRGYAREVIMRAKAAGYRRDRADDRLDARLSARQQHPQRFPHSGVARQRQRARQTSRISIKAAQIMNRRKVDLNLRRHALDQAGDGASRRHQGRDVAARPRCRRSSAASMRSTSRTTADARSTACPPRSRSCRASPTPCGAACRSSSTAASGAARTCSARSRLAPMWSRAAARCCTALALGGHLGAQSVLEYLRDDLYIVMQLAGTPNIKSITRDYIVHS